MRAFSSARQHGKDLVGPGLAAGLGLLPSILAIEQGGYSATTWMAAAVLLALAVLALVWGRAFSYSGSAGPLGRAPLVGLALLGLFVLWNFLSTSWAVDKAAAFQEATRTLFYGLLLLLSVALTRSARARRAFLTAFVLGAAGIAVLTVIKLEVMAHPEDLWGDFKLQYPIGYSNALAAFYAIAVLPGFYLATRREAAVWLRSLLFAATTLMLLVSQLSQSRAAFWSLVGAGIVYVAVTPRRLRAILWGAILLSLIVVGFGPINALYPHLSREPVDIAGFHGDLPSAVTVLILCPLIGAAVCAGLCLVERRLVVSARQLLLARVAVAVVMLASVVLAFVQYPVLQHPAGTAEGIWRQFTGRSEDPSQTGHPYLLGFYGSGRYPIWQVAWDVAIAHPLRGVGADNFVIEWNRLRQTPRDVRQPHNLSLRLAAEEGIPGLALFSVGIGLLLVSGLLRTWGRKEQAFFAAILGACIYYLVHDSAEWLWEFPTLGGTFFLMLGVVVGLSGGDREGEPSRLGRSGLPSILAVVAVSVLVVTSPQYLSYRLAGQARLLNAAGKHTEARSAAHWAAGLNPFSTEPLVEEAEAWAAEDNATASDGAYRAALRRNPSDQQVYLSWATTLRARGADPAPALAKVRALNPLLQALE